MTLSAGEQGVKSKTDYACRTVDVGLADAGSTPATSTIAKQKAASRGLLLGSYLAVGARTHVAV